MAATATASLLTGRLTVVHMNIRGSATLRFHGGEFAGTVGVRRRLTGAQREVTVLSIRQLRLGSWMWGAAPCCHVMRDNRWNEIQINDEYIELNKNNMSLDPDLHFTHTANLLLSYYRYYSGTLRCVYLPWLQWVSQCRYMCNPMSSGALQKLWLLHKKLTTAKTACKCKWAVKLYYKWINHHLYIWVARL